jgi:6-phosphogluconolactonase
MTANYGSGSAASFPIRPDGTIAEAAGVMQHNGSSVNPKRQTGPHAHSVFVAPDNRFALVPDLGVDKVFVHRMNPATATLMANDPPFAALEHGSGPRHLAFARDGRFVHVLNELTSTITTFTYDKERGALFEAETVSTLPGGFAGASSNTCAEILVSPDGRFVYASNRGHDSIAVFAAETGTGRLTPVEHTPTQGRTPRNFAIDPTGRWLFAENQASDSVVLFAVDSRSGRLKSTGRTLTIGSPVCAVFVPLK